MTPARKTTAVLVLAGLVAAGAALLSRATPTGASLPTAAGELTIDARLQSSHLLQGVSETYLAVTIDAPEAIAERARPPVHVAIVLDRSLSMYGEKMEHAREAARQVVRQLGPADRFAVIAYGSRVEVVFPATAATPPAREAALIAIDRIREEGATYLSGGLLAGRDELLPHADERAVSRIVLISDGLANEGVVAPAQLAALARDIAARGISLTTVGVGLDFDERTMTRLAVEGRGNYYFVESSAALAGMFTRELARLGATVATDVTVAVRPAPGVAVLEAYGHELSAGDGRVLIPIADLDAGETRKVVLRLRVEAPHLGARNLAEVDVTFRGEGGARRQVAMRARAEVTASGEAVHAHRDRGAIRHIERARAARAIEEAAAHYERGDDAAALDVLEREARRAAALSRAISDADLGSEIRGAIGGAAQGFSAAPASPASEGGQRVLKDNRKQAYELMY